MQSSYTAILIMSTLSFCGDSTSSNDTPTSSGFSCEDYQIMLDVEIELATECSSSSQCQQVLVEGDLECEANSIVGNVNFDSNYFFDLYDEAIAVGCTNLSFPMNQECSDTEIACINAECTWQ